MVDRRGWWYGPATIDGLAGSGKSTVAAVLSGGVIPVLEVGGLYRRLARRAPATMELLPVDQSGDWVTRYLDGAAPSEPDLDGDLDRLLAVTQDHRIRRAVAHYQVIWASRSEQSIVVGRVGGHLFPTAEVKLFLSVDPREQNRRFGDERVHGARLRDEADRHREHDPVHPAEGAARIDTSGRTPEEVVAIIDDLVRRRSRQ